MSQMMRDPNAIQVGVGDLYFNGEHLGILKGGVALSYKPTSTKITGGSPEVTIRTSVTAEEASLTADLMELNPSVMGTIMGLFTYETTSSSTSAITHEYLGALGTDTWVSADHKDWTTATVTVKPASMLTASVAAGEDTIYVANASMFTAGDSVTLKEGATTENLTIKADGVDTSANTIQFTANLSNSYTSSGYAVDTTVAPEENTDFDIDPISGRIRRITDSSVLDADDTVAISYTYNVATAEHLYFGGATTNTPHQMEFISDERPDGKRWHIIFWSAQLTTDGFDISFSTDEPALMNVTFEALADGTKDSGKTLGDWYLA